MPVPSSNEPGPSSSQSSLQSADQRPGHLQSGPRDVETGRYDEEAQKLVSERLGLLRTISSMLDAPMTILSFVWLVLLIVDFTGGMTHSLETANLVLWALFGLHFALEFWIAPRKVKYLRRNWLTALALLLPAFRLLRAFRVLRFLRAARFGRSVRLLRWVTSLNRGMKATRRTLRKRGLTYVLALTVIVCFVGAAGVYVFESPAMLQAEGLADTGSSVGIGSYGEAVWWTAMMLTTMGSDYFPRTTEGRIVALLLAVYAFAIFGYITATVASLIINVDQEKKGVVPERPNATSFDPVAFREMQLGLLRIEEKLSLVLSVLGKRDP